MAEQKSSKSIIARELKLILRPAQERMLVRWLNHLTGVYNWAVRKIELDAIDGRYHSVYDLGFLLNGHSRRIGVPMATMREVAKTAQVAWGRRFQNTGGRPRRKGRRNKLSSIPFPVQIDAPVGHRVWLQNIGLLKFHAQEVPAGAIKQGRIVRRASGWYLVLSIEAEPSPIPHVGHGEVGIDPGFSSLLTFSNGEVIDRPVEMKRSAVRLAQAKRGGRRKLAARIYERIARQRRDRNHKLSRRIVSENAAIYWLKDDHRALARRFG